MVATVFDLLGANYGIDRGLGGDNVAASYDDDEPYTPAWQETITGVAADQIIAVARQFADNAEKTEGRSMVIIGAGMNHWYHMDMNYRGIINMLVMCGCIGKSGGGWAHYVGQEKLRPQTGWTPLAFGARLGPPAASDELDFVLLCAHRPVAIRKARRRRRSCRRCADPDDLSRHASSTTTCGPSAWAGCRRRRSSSTNPLTIAAPGEGGRARSAKDLCRRRPEVRAHSNCPAEDPDAPDELPAQLVRLAVQPAGLVGQRARVFPQVPAGHQQRRAGQGPRPEGGEKPQEVVWHEQAPEGKLDLLVTLDFRMSTTCVYSDIVLPTATWYEKNDLNTSDMHPFIHPLSAAVDPAWEVAHATGRSTRPSPRAFSELSPEVIWASSATWC